MAKFKYKFENIHRIKKTIEKKVQREVAEIELEIDRRLAEVKNLLAEKQEKKIELKNKKSLKVSELQFHEQFFLTIDKKVELINDDIVKLKKDKEIKMNELVEKSKETKMFEKLEEKHFEIFQKEENKLEQVEMDDIATKKFVRSK
ncbi:MAG: flagellar export protein FliJ [Ignavibacteria bacterium]|jgi:flagellar FliJ protein